MVKECIRCSASYKSKPGRNRQFCSRKCYFAAKTDVPLIDRLFQHIQKTKTCWLWTASTHNYGYGKIRVNGRNERAHRLMYQLVKGPVAPHERVLHTCDNPPCCNPDHLTKNTQLANIADMRKKNRHAHGETSYAKLTEADVLAIRADTRSQRRIAADYGVIQQTISLIKTRKNWSHLP